MAILKKLAIEVKNETELKDVKEKVNAKELAICESSGMVYPFFVTVDEKSKVNYHYSNRIKGFKYIGLEELKVLVA